MAADQIELRTTTFTKGHGWLDSYGTLLRDNDVLLGRGRWTTGETVLAQVDCQPGAWQIQPGDRLLRAWRLDGTATADDAARLLLSTPIRGSWHSDDNSGATPALDNRVVKGDSCQIDTGSGDSYVLHYDGSRFRGYGVLAESRDLATSIAPAKASEQVVLRASVWDTGAAKYRQWHLRTDASDASSDFLSVYRTVEGSSERLVTRITQNSTLEMWGTPTGNIVPGLKYSRDRTGSSPGQISFVFSTETTDIDGTAVWFHHGDNTRFARHRFRGSDAGALGAAAEVLSASYRLPATLLATTRNSASVGHVGNYWNGAVGVEATAYSQLILTGTDPTGYVEHGFDFGSGISRLYNHGLLAVAGSSTGGLLLSRYDDIDPSNPMLDSPNLTLRGVSEGVSGGEDREFKLRCFIGSPATEGDVWAMVYNNGNEDVGGVLMDGSRMVSDTASSVLAFQLAEDVHPALSGATTKTTPGAVDRWIAIDANGTTVYVPAYTSKTA